MENKDLKRMRRSDLIEIIYEYQSREQILTRKNEELAALLSDRRTHIEKAGSIAEAALALQHIFEAAQAAADLYVDEVRDANADADRRAREILDAARREADAMRRQAREECDVMRGKVTELLANYQELRSLMAGQEKAAE